MKFRKLRIVFSAVCGIICLLLIALWVRSYWYGNIVEWRTNTRLFRLDSRFGRIEFWRHQPVTPIGQYRPMILREPTFRLHNVANIGQGQSFVPDYSVMGFGLYRGNRYSIVYMPYWFVCLTCAFFAAAPWLPWRRRFSFRELLLAMTLVALVLGHIAVWR